MSVAIDIGNTNIVIGVHNTNGELQTIRLETTDLLSSLNWSTCEDFIKQNLSGDMQWRNVIVSSVVPQLNDSLVAHIKARDAHATIHFVTMNSPLNITIAVDQPEAVGTDRLVNASIAHLEHKRDLIVVDMGTATKFDCVKNGVFVGGIIAPGLVASANALFAKAAKLSPVPLAKPKQLIGRNTVDCLQSGIYHGNLALITNMVERLKSDQMKDALVIATGGHSLLFFDDLKKIVDVIDPDLTIRGLFDIMKRL